ncbi:MAG TPA: DUF3426 domain-containing protein [Rhodocyclaceae bacterium]|nr:DUF3426 domain-containing protein [Rhodocyclaceae bacterium]
MLTRCPHCTTTFRVKPEQLKARLGRVRCGECRTVFNALDSLVEEVPQAAAPLDATETPITLHSTPQSAEVTLDHEVDAPTAETEAQLPDAAPETEAEPEPAPETPPLNATFDEPESPQKTELAATEPSAPEALTPKPHIPEEVEETEASQPLPEPELPSEEQPIAESSPEPQPETPSAAQEEAFDNLDFTLTDEVKAAAPTTTESAEPAIQASETLPLESAAQEEAPSSATTAAEHDPLLHHAPRTARRWPWVVLAVLASLLLVGQAIFYYRVEVAVAAPALKPLLKATCESLGCEVPRPRKAEMLDIESSDLHPGKQKGRLQLVAVLKNKAPFSQELPVLEVSLTDVADRALIVKALQPADYLPAGRKPTTGFPAKGEINVSLTLDAGDTPASGYRLYLYYP